MRSPPARRRTPARSPRFFPRGERPSAAGGAPATTPPAAAASARSLRHRAGRAPPPPRGIPPPWPVRSSAPPTGSRGKPRPARPAGTASPAPMQRPIHPAFSCAASCANRWKTAHTLSPEPNFFRHAGRSREIAQSNGNIHRPLSAEAGRGEESNHQFL